MADILETKPLPSGFYTPLPLRNWGEKEIRAWLKDHPDIPRASIERHIEMAQYPSHRRWG